MPRNLALCFDGTWNSDDASSPTNVVKTHKAICPATSAGTQQISYYDRGVGTGRFDRFRGGVLGLGLARNVEVAYEWLTANYRAGDRLFLFGYSRGAYTARSLAGLIGLCGIPDAGLCALAGCLPPAAARRAMQIYRLRAGKDRDERAARHRDTFCGPPAASTAGSARVLRLSSTVHFVGVWDTVGALGVPVTWLNWIGARRHRFHDVRLDRHIRCACHAVSVDEGRRPFAPTLWLNLPVQGQEVEQLWFPGVHGDVGGGRPHTGLSDGALLWMWAKAFAAGLAFEPGAVSRELAPDPFGPQGKMSFVYRVWGRHDRPVGEADENGRPAVTGEAVHFSAIRRLESPESAPYRHGVARRTLLPALEEERVQPAPPAPGEVNPTSQDWSSPPEPSVRRLLAGTAASRAAASPTTRPQTSTDSVT